VLAALAIDTRFSADRIAAIAKQLMRYRGCANQLSFVALTMNDAPAFTNWRNRSGKMISQQITARTAAVRPRIACVLARHKLAEAGGDRLGQVTIR